MKQTAPHTSRRRFLQQSAAALLLSGTPMVFGATTAKSPSRLDSFNLLEFHSTDGTVRPVKSKADWQQRRAEIVRGMESVMGSLPGKDKRCTLDVRIEEEADAGTHVRRFITYAAEPGGRVPAYLLIPKNVLHGRSKAHAVLCLHPTDNVNGHKVVVGLGGKANRQYAQELADIGFVTLAPAYPLLANYQPDLAALGYASGTMKAIWDNIRGLDLLETLPFVRRGAFGVIGHSLGGHNSVFTSVFDERIRVIVSSCGLDSFLDYYGGSPSVWQREKGWCQTRYMLRLLDYAGKLETIPFDFPELIGALAPRTCFINAPLRDANFKWESVDRVVKSARDVYRLYGKPENLLVEHPDSEHDFPDAMRQLAYGLIERELR